jgi:adenylate cyclase
MRYLDRVRVKGKEHPVEIYELFTEETLPDQDELALYDTALALYREDALAEARERFETLESRYPTPLYTLYAERCRQPDRL